MRRLLLLPIFALLVLQTGCVSAPQSDAEGASRVTRANHTIERFKRTNPTLSAAFFESAKAWAVFPSVGKGAVGLGGAYGKGVLFENNQPVGYCDLAQATLGFQLGGQVYSEIIFFETPYTLADFKTGAFKFAAQASAVAVSADTSANAGYEYGVAVFTLTGKGLMYEASIGGQKFDYSRKR